LLIFSRVPILLIYLEAFKRPFLLTFCLSIQSNSFLGNHVSRSSSLSKTSHLPQTLFYTRRNKQIDHHKSQIWLNWISLGPNNMFTNFFSKFLNYLASLKSQCLDPHPWAKLRTSHNTKWTYCPLQEPDLIQVNFSGSKKFTRSLFKCTKCTN
jgi:hypothetical protein